MNIGRCECINNQHKVNLKKALESEINKLDTEYRSLEQNKLRWNKSFQRGEVSVSAEKLLETINQNKNNFQSTLTEINSIIECN